MSVYAKTWAYEQQTGSPGRKHVLVALAEFADYEGVCRPGQQTLADMTEFDDRTVRRHLAKLEEDGFIERVERRRKDGTRTSDETRLLAPEERLRPPSKRRENGVSDQPDNMPAGTPSTGHSDPINRTKKAHQPVKMPGPIDRKLEPSGEPSVGTAQTPPLDDEKPARKLAYLDDDTRRTVETLLFIQSWDKSEARTAEIVADVKKTYPRLDVLATATSLAFKIRTGAVGPYKVPSRAFANWAASDAERASSGFGDGEAPRRRKKTL